ncbi:MAG: monofunctional biosynthetic peptidoglycan transglycosylase [Chitinophagaceae bacterium]|nr:MAG: monofunctional biosynthetic peptidoglycan transglycosylase [Chitinophagaceae bacterium]
MTTKGLFPRIWRWTKRIFIILFIAQFVYIILLRWINPPITITQLVSWVTGHGLKRDYVDRSEISSNARLAVIASEDQKFTDHSGFDWKSIQKAMKYNEKKPGRTVRGGSTISQQVAKNVFLWQGRSWIRKGLEGYFTFMIELLWNKERILEVYLNVIEMGEGIFGVERAANIYFNKNASQLSAQEASLIAACLPNPKVYRVKPASPFMIRRSREIMTQMRFLRPDPDIAAVIDEVKPAKK